MMTRRDWLLNQLEELVRRKARGISAINDEFVQQAAKDNVVRPELEIIELAIIGVHYLLTTETTPTDPNGPVRMDPAQNVARLMA